MSKICKYLLILFCIGVCNGNLIITSTLASDITLILDGQPVISDVQPEIKNSTTFVPIRTISDNFNANVEYNPADREIGITADYVFITNYLTEERVREVKMATAQIQLFENGIEFRVGDPNAYVVYDVIADGNVSTEEIHSFTPEVYPLIAAPYIKNQRIMVPLRFIAERIGFTVNYADNKITLTSTKKLLLDGVEIRDMLLEDDYVTTNKVLISSAVKLLEKARRQQCAAVSDYAYVTPKLAFSNAAGQTVAIWQFAAPKGESWQEQPFSALYLHDRLNNVWYMADQKVYDELYNNKLGNYFLPPYYSFEKLKA